jgi:hypothetical protein
MSIIICAKLCALNEKCGKEPLKPRRGALGRKAAKAHMKTKEQMADVIANPDDYDEHTKKQANFMKTLLSFKHGK